MALSERVRAGRLRDPAKIGAAADRVLRASGLGRCFKVTVREGFFSWDYDVDAMTYEEELLAGRYVLVTSLDPTTASTASVVRDYLALQEVERRFRVLKDFLGLRPIYHFTERRVRGHVALCVLASVVEALMGRDLRDAGVMDPDLPEQFCSTRRGLRELSRVRAVELMADDGSRRRVITRPGPFQSSILAALGVDARHWSSRVG